MWPTPSVLFAVSHGVVIGPLMPSGDPFVVAQTSSPASTDLLVQSMPSTPVSTSSPLAPPFHLKTLIVLTPPPLVKAETTSRSPSLWLPVNAVLPFDDVQSIPTIFFIDRRGVILSVEVGYDGYEELRNHAFAEESEQPPDFHSQKAHH